MLEMTSSHPVEIRIVKGSEQETTSKIALKVLSQYGPMTIMEILDPEEDQARITTLGYPLKEINMAYLCVAEICIPASIDKIESAFEMINGIVRKPTSGHALKGSS